MNNKIDELIGKMTFDEKIEMICGRVNMGAPFNERLGIKPLTMCDGPHGVRFEEDTSTNCTSLPCLSALGATWSKETAHLYGECIAKDCIRHNKAMILGPGVNIKRIDLCGRNFEYFSEDPYLSGIMAAEYINGVEENGVGSCIKHFAVNNQEVDRLHISSEIDERTMREIYLKSFRIAVENSNPASVMCAVNKINSVLCSENKMLLNDILKEEWGYEGFVMSDWGCSKDATKSLLAGLDLCMPQMQGRKENIYMNIESGRVSKEELETALDKAIRRILKWILAYSEKEIEYDRDEQHSIARKVSEESIVLLKNEDNLLPITKEKYKKITVIGGFAEKPVISGYGSSRVYPSPEYIESPIDCIIKEAGGDIEVDYIPIYPSDGILECTCFNKLPLLDNIGESDLVVMFVGRVESAETEGTDRITSQLDPYYEFYIKRIFPKNQNIVLVAQTGGAFMDLTWNAKVKSIVQMWLSGEAGGSAIARVLFGKVNPSGRIEETFPVRTRTDIDYPGDGFKVCYDEKWRVGYRYYDSNPQEVWFPFGHGLSYTDFEYSNFNAVLTADGTEISVDVKNTGGMDGKEVVQLYFTDCVSTVSRPQKELCGFEKVFIKSGETKTVEFTVKNKDLAYYNTCLKKWVTEPGGYVFSVGASAQDIRLSQKVYLDTECEYTLRYNAEQIMG